MATSKNYITAGFPPDDNGSDIGTTLFYITAGLIPDDTEGGPPPETSIPVFMNFYRQLRAA